MQRSNILFSTTRQWNCGDEFIRFGIRNLLESLGAEYNPVIYNRHPSITPQKYNRKHPWSFRKLNPHRDNSFILDDPKAIDYVILAGSPEWAWGQRSSNLHRFILDNKLRCAFLGVGIGNPQAFGPHLKQVLLERTDLIVARDPNCYELIKEYPNSYFDVCPAIFSARKPRPRPAPGAKLKIGFVIPGPPARSIKAFRRNCSSVACAKSNCCARNFRSRTLRITSMN